MFTEIKPTRSQIKKFQNTVWNYYRANGRNFAWREKVTPYRVVVSEIMLQQTQTERVAKKFPEFISLFPNFTSLARASKADVIRAWQGLGYNRRAVALHAIAQKVMNDYKGRLPKNPEQLIALPGIGPNTAGSIMAFAFNIPTTFIETNIRSVFIHYFFPLAGQDKVHDKNLIPLITQTVDNHSPREWYYALMDYGVYLKKEFKNPSRQSVHHAKQSRFKGSNRELRGALIRLLAIKSHSSIQLVKILGRDMIDVQTALQQLVAEGLLQQKGQRFSLSF